MSPFQLLDVTFSASDSRPDHHWIVQHADGTWTGRHGTTSEIDQTTPAGQTKGGKLSGLFTPPNTLCGCWNMPGRIPTNPLQTLQKLRNYWNANHLDPDVEMNKIMNTLPPNPNTNK